VYPLADLLAEVVAQSDESVVVEQFSSQRLSRDVGLRTAGAALTGTVEVFVAVLDQGVDQATAAALAAKDTLQVVIEAAFADAGSAVAVDDPLHPVEQFAVYQWFMPAGVPLASVLDLADVEAIAEHVRQGGHDDRSNRLGRGSPQRKAALDHFSGQGLKGVIASGVQLEALPDQGGPVAFVVQADGADFPALGKVADVAVADWCDADRATLGHH